MTLKLGMILSISILLVLNALNFRRRLIHYMKLNSKYSEVIRSIISDYEYQNYKNYCEVSVADDYKFNILE